jgi:low affinity Fe/Cu permease
VLYVVAFISLIDVIAYIVNREFGAVIFFYLIGLIAYKFSTNMTFVLGSALIATSLVHLLKNMFGFKEGFSKKKIKEGIDHSEDEEEDEEEIDVLKKEEKNREKQIKEEQQEQKREHHEKHRAFEEGQRQKEQQEQRLKQEEEQKE